MVVVDALGAGAAAATHGSNVIVDSSAAGADADQLNHHIVTTSDGTVLTEVQVEAIPNHHHHSALSTGML